MARGVIGILSPVFLLAATISFTPSKAALQTHQYEYAFKDTPLQEVLAAIEKQFGCTFLYSGTQIDLNTRVNAQIGEDSLDKVLDKIFGGMPIKYEIKDRTIILNTVAPVPAKQDESRKTLSGFVRDQSGNPIIGATVVVKNTDKGAVTDINGLFSVQVGVPSPVIVVSCIGYDTREVSVEGLESVIVAMAESTQNIEEVVVTAFGLGQKKETMVGSIQQIVPTDLQVPASSLSESFAGRLAGVIAVQRTGEPGADGANFWIRGKSTFGSATGALIVIDGVEASSATMNALDPEVIESFAILKDATATALYGTRGANGVMIITTKKGADLLKPIINFRMETSVNQLTAIPQMVDGTWYMKLYNEAKTTRGDYADLYSYDKIVNTGSGNPYIYPNVDWYNEMFNNLASSQRLNINIRGGKQTVRYFMSASMKHDGGHMKSISRDYYSYNNNISVMRYDFVNNIDIDVTKTTNLSLGINASMRDRKGPNKTAAAIFEITREASPVDFPILFPGGESIMWGGKLGGAYNSGFRNPVAEYVNNYNNAFSSELNASLKLNQDLKFVTPGLTFRALASFINNSSTSVTRSSNYNQYEIASVDPATEEYVLRIVGNELDTKLTSASSSGGNRRIYLQGIMNYDRKFGKHDLNLMFLYNQDEYLYNNPSALEGTVAINSLPQRKQGIAGRVSYAFGNRYLAEANFGYNGSENFAAGHRWGFFPSFAVGYAISQEKFWEPLSKVISHLKFRASWGLVGNDAVGSRFAYLEEITLGSLGYVTGTSMASGGPYGPAWVRYYNPNLTWEVGEKINLGMDLQLFRDLNIYFDVFREHRRNIFMQRTNSVPQFLGTGSTTIYGNVGEVMNRGIDLSVDYNRSVSSDLFISFKGTFTFAKNEILARDEPPYRQYPNLSYLGHSVDQRLLYISEGLFRDWDDVAASPSQSLGYDPMPGDIKYRDFSDVDGIADGNIDSSDRMYTGYPTVPEIVYGFGPSIRYKKWDFSLFFQGAARTSLIMNGFHPFGDRSMRGVMQFIAEDRWTEQNRNVDAKYPRLTRDSNANNTENSTYWLRNGAFLKLKNAEIGFSHKFLRIYVSGSNLLTFSQFKLWDPEMGGGSGMKYPNTRVYNIGVQMTFK